MYLFGNASFWTSLAGHLITPHACARGKAIGLVCLLSVVVVIVITKIARSRVLGIYACCNYHELVDISEKKLLVRPSR